MTTSREKCLFTFWMNFFIEGIKQESSGSQFPVRYTHLHTYIIHMYIHGELKIPICHRTFSDLFQHTYDQANSNLVGQIYCTYIFPMDKLMIICNKVLF